MRRAAESSRHGRATAAVVCGLLAVLHAAWFLRAGPVDDDYILYRYASHLVRGDGLVFNPGERVEGFTTPLTVLLYALGLLVRVDPWTASRAISFAGCAAAAASVAMAWFALRPSSRVPVPALLAAASPAIAYHASAGLGTTLVAGLLALWAWRWIEDLRQERASFLPAILLGLACLARAEAVLFAIPFALVELRRKRAVPAAIAFLPLGGWTAFRLAYYGALLPVTYHVKKLPFLVDLGFGLEYLARSTATTGIGIALLLASAFLLRPGRRSPALASIALGLLATTLFVVYVGGDYMNLARFFVPVLPLAILLAACAAAEWIPSVAAGTAVTAACLVFLQWPRQERSDVFRYEEQLEQRWIRVGETLALAAQPGQSVAVGAVGAIGYYSGLPIVDRLGMTNDAIWRTAPDLSVPMKGHHRFDSSWVLAQHPDLVLVGSGLFVEGTSTLAGLPPDRQMLQEPLFRTAYRPMAVEVAESYPLVFFLRNGATPPVGARSVEVR